MQIYPKNNIPLQQLADAANTLTRFLGVRDLPELSPQTLQSKYGIKQADVLILFGGTIPFGCDVAATVWKRGVARHLMVVGGIGHTTQSLRAKFKARFPDMETNDKAEAEMIANYLSRKYDIHDILLETKSTNCGNNVTYALAKLKEAAIPAKSLIIMQEPSMQRRMAAGFAKELKYNTDTTVINYAPYLPYLATENGALRFIRQYWGLWDIEHYITLLLGDISRLRDDTQGYGPNGKGFITHVDIPPEVEKAFHILNVSQLGTIRTANPAFRS
jgi:uncharacterized SAM-binding protein YcdF (DUF218 family)